MSDELDVNPESPDAAPAVAEAPAKPDFVAHPVYTSVLAHIEAEGREASARLHQLLAEMRDLFNL
jgi:hypothetical protein